MTTDQEKKPLDHEEEEFVTWVATHYAPEPLAPAKRAAFDRALEARLARRARAPFRWSAAGVVTACTALFLWVAVRNHGPVVPAGGENPRVVMAGREESPSAADEATLLTYAYDSAEFYGDDDEEGEENFLPEEYEALAAAFDLPGA